MRLAEFFAKYTGDSGVPTYRHREEVRPGVWLGSAQARRHLEGIDVVISAMTTFERRTMLGLYDGGGGGGGEDEDDKLPNATEYKIELDDTPDAPILTALDQVEQILDNELARGRVCLVHCMAGVSRSAALVIGYLMRKERLDFAQALAEVQRARPVASPNGGFRHSLSAARMEEWWGDDACDEWVALPPPPSSDDDASAPFCDKYRGQLSPLQGKLRRGEALTQDERQLLVRVLRDVINHMTLEAVPAKRRPLPSSPRSTLDDPD